MKKLKAPTQSSARLTERVRALGATLGPLLFQLPPKWKQNPDRLDTFLSGLPSDMDYAFEFRDPSWMNDHIFDILTRHRVAFCIYELSGYQSPLWVTSTVSYVRLHGPEAAYEGSYDENTLSWWAQWAKARERDGIDIYFYFDNDQHGYAAANALSLLSLL